MFNNIQKLSYALLILPVFMVACNNSQDTTTAQGPAGAVVADGWASFGAHSGVYPNQVTFTLIDSSSPNPSPSASPSSTPGPTVIQVNSETPNTHVPGTYLAQCRTVNKRSGLDIHIISPALNGAAFDLYFAKFDPTETSYTVTGKVGDSSLAIVRMEGNTLETFATLNAASTTGISISSSCGVNLQGANGVLTGSFNCTNLYNTVPNPPVRDTLPVTGSFKCKLDVI